MIRSDRHSSNLSSELSNLLSVQLDSGQFQEQSPEYVRYKEWHDKIADELRQSVRRIFMFMDRALASIFLIYPSFQFTNMKVQTSNLANHHLNMIKQLKDVQYRILDQELNKWKRDQQLAGNGAAFANNLDQIQKW